MRERGAAPPHRTAVSASWASRTPVRVSAAGDWPGAGRGWGRTLPRQPLSPCARGSSAVPPVRGGSHPPPPQGAVRVWGEMQSTMERSPRAQGGSCLDTLQGALLGHPPQGPSENTAGPRHSPRTHGQARASFLPDLTPYPKTPAALSPRKQGRHRQDPGASPLKGDQARRGARLGRHGLGWRAGLRAQRPRSMITGTFSPGNGRI